MYILHLNMQLWDSQQKASILSKKKKTPHTHEKKQIGHNAEKKKKENLSWTTLGEANQLTRFHKESRVLNKHTTMALTLAVLVGRVRVTYRDEDEEQEERPKQLYDQLDLWRSSWYIMVWDNWTSDNDDNDDAAWLPCSSCGRWSSSTAGVRVGFLCPYWRLDDPDVDEPKVTTIKTTQYYTIKTQVLSNLKSSDEISGLAVICLKTSQH